ncbi:MAG TPA: Asd/ArgC dimerization domain-containing protein [Candidatus Acidoferrum sp.]|nr:Asd/ArgC dimerization domain-containing protein [Candidatus Acidoferrum sp.]
MSTGALHDHVAIVGASSLLGKELKRVLEDRNFPASEIILLDTSEVAGILTDAAGEATFIRSLDEDSFEHARFVFFTGSPVDARQNLSAALSSGATVVDLTGGSLASTGAVISSPSLSTMLLPVPTKPSIPGPIYFSPSSPVLIAATLSAVLSKFSPARIALTLFPPVSEFDQSGVDELESQSAALLSFRPISQTVFDSQVAFNLLDRFGDSARSSLDKIRRTVSSITSQFLAGRAQSPAIQLIQAPMFYGYAFSAYAEFPALPPASEVHSALAALGVRIASDEDPPPTNLAAAGEDNILLSPVRPDDSHPSAYWFWGVADNLRFAAINAVRIAEDLLARQ